MATIGKVGVAFKRVSLYFFFIINMFIGIVI